MQHTLTTSSRHKFFTRGSMSFVHAVELGSHFLQRCKQYEDGEAPDRRCGTKEPGKPKHPLTPTIVHDLEALQAPSEIGEKNVRESASMVQAVVKDNKVSRSSRDMATGIFGSSLFMAPPNGAKAISVRVVLQVQYSLVHPRGVWRKLRGG